MTLTASPKLLKGGLVVIDATSGAVKLTIALQYNPGTLTGKWGQSPESQPRKRLQRHEPLR